MLPFMVVSSDSLLFTILLFLLFIVILFLLFTTTLTLLTLLPLLFIITLTLPPLLPLLFVILLFLLRTVSLISSRDKSTTIVSKVLFVVILLCLFRSAFSQKSEKSAMI